MTDSIRSMCAIVILLEIGMVLLGVLWLMGIRVLKVVHHSWKATTTGPIDTPMLLMPLIKHAVMVLRGRVGGTSWRGSFESRARIVRWCGIAGDLVSLVMGLRMLSLLLLLYVRRRKIVAPNVLRESIICHLTIERLAEASTSHRASAA